MRLLPHARARQHQGRRSARTSTKPSAASIAEGAAARSAVRSVVEGQVADPNSRRRDAQRTSPAARTLTDIAAYVAAGRPTGPGRTRGLLASAVEGAGSGKPAVEKAGKLRDPRQPDRPARLRDQQGRPPAAGAVTIAMPNMSGVSHNIAIEAGDRRSDREGRGDRRQLVHHQGHRLGHRQPEARHLHLLLPGSRPPRRGDVRHAHRQALRAVDAAHSCVLGRSRA